MNFFLNKNIEKVFRVLILLLFSLVFSLTIINSSVYNFVHKRHIPMIIFSIIIFLILAIIEIVYNEHNTQEETKDKANNNSNSYSLKKCISYFILLVPLFLYFFSGSGIKFSSLAQNIDLKNQAVPKKRKSSSANPFTGMQKNSMALTDGKIIISSENFSQWLSELYSNPYNYYEKEIELSGELWYGKDLGENQFAVGRLMMVCCAADMQAVGLFCESAKKSDFKDGEWVKVKGLLKERFIQDDASEPYIEIQSIEKEARPENVYVYPF